MNPERLLGALVKQGLRSKGRKSGVSRLLRPGWKGAAGLGALGVAIAAFEHFTAKDQTTGAQVASRGTPPTPPEGGQAKAAPPPPPPAPNASETPSRDPKDEASLLLIRAMILAAHADGEIDEEEKSRILGRIREAGVSQEELSLLEKEMDSPLSMSALVEQVTNQELAHQVYMVSCLAIEIDTESERDYLAYLRSRLDIDEAVAAEIHERLEGDER